MHLHLGLAGCPSVLGQSCLQSLLQEAVEQQASLREASSAAV